MKTITSKVFLFNIIMVLGMFNSQQAHSQLRGDSNAILEAEAMVEQMGGKRIWSQLKSVHFVHSWYFWDRDSYIEDEILDLTAPRSWVNMKNETYHRLRAYSPENKYWNVVNGKFSYAGDNAFNAAMKRGPFNIYRIARAVAIGDSNYEVRLGDEEFPGSRKIEFYDTAGNFGGYIVLNANKEPLVWATTQYKYTFGPMKKFGNLWVPNWAVTANGAVTYEMISLTGDNQLPDPKLFVPPSEYVEN